MCGTLVGTTCVATYDSDSAAYCYYLGKLQEKPLLF
jgi:hypothetical protein